MGRNSVPELDATRERIAGACSGRARHKPIHTAIGATQITAEKLQELYLNLDRGTAIGGDLLRKPDDSKGRKRRRKRNEQDAEGDPRELEWMGKALADGGMQFPKLLKPLDIREGQQMNHAPHDHKHAMEESVGEDGREIHAMGARVSDGVGWSLAALASGLRPDESVMFLLQHGHLSSTGYHSGIKLVSPGCRRGIRHI